jgi:hypothetical protein
MGPTGQALRLRDGYRFQAGPLLFTFAFLAVLAGFSHAFKQPWVTFALIPLAMLFQRMNAYRFLLLVFAAFIIFFPGNFPGSSIIFALVPDGLTLAFILLMALSWWTEKASMPIPVNRVLLPMYLFTAYVLLLSARSVLAGTSLGYIVFDLRGILYLPLGSLLLALDGREREPKKVFLLLAAFVFFCSVHSMWAIYEFAGSMNRAVTWNEIFLSDAVIVSALLLEMPVGKRTRWLLGTGLALNILGLLVTQTRGLWLSTVFAVALIYGIRALASRTIRFSALAWSLLLLTVAAVAANTLVASLIGISLRDVVMERVAVIEPDELINPFTSGGYRIHESWTVWDQRSLFGHGTGATLHLFSTLYKPGYYMNWWSIHSGYFEILHKFGFVGLGIFLWMLGALLLSGWRKARSGSRTTALYGNVIVAVLVNHAVVSVSSGYLMKWATLVFMLFYFILGKLESPGSLKRGTAKSAPPIGA